MSTSIEEITEIIKIGYADLSGVDPKDVDVYNVQETTPPGTYTYDATVYFRASDTNAETRAAEFKNAISTDATQFSNNLLTKITEKRPDLASKVSASVDVDSPKLTRSLNKGKSKPRFDRIVPTVEGFGTDVGVPDFLEIKDVTCVRASTQMTTSFTIHTSLSNEKFYWYMKLATVPDLETKNGFEDWMRTTDPLQAQSNYTITSGDTYTLSNRVISKVFQANMQSTADLSAVTGPVYVYIQVYFEKYPDFSTLFVEPM